VDAQARRSAAYADLVSALLDLRSPGPTDAFDLLLQRAVDEGALSPDLARELRWLQRESVRSIVRHAQLVLPVTLLALEQEASSEHEEHEEHDEHDEHETGDNEPEVTETSGPPASARRLLVAGLRPLHDSPGMTP
jgi:hypothetical protein